MTRYYIRFRGRRVGPLTIEKIHSLARRGRFGRHFEVSTNGRTWGPAVDYPELFEDGGGGDLDGYGDGFDEFGETPADVDVDAPLVDEAPSRSGAAGGGRRSRPSRAGRRGSRSAAGGDEFDEAAADARPARRGRSRRRRPGSDDDTEANPGGFPTPVADPIVPSDDGPPRRRRSGGGRRRESNAVDEPLPTMPLAADSPIPDLGLADAVGDQPTGGHSDDAGDERKGPKKKKKKKKQKKKSGGLFGLFGGGEQAPEERSEHLESLYNISSRLRPMPFQLKDVVLVGSGNEQLPVVGHHDEGEGIETLGLLKMIAFQTRSTDIHLEPKVDGYEARLRIDGMLVPVAQLSKHVAARVSGVIKVLCEIDFAGQMGIQEGSYSSIAPGRRTDYRISFTPSHHGQKLAIRVLDLSNSPQSLAQLGAPRTVIGKLQRVMQQNAGMILMCGPTGSGKTTTLYSLIRAINVRERNVMTLEDPVEYQIPGVTQSSIDEEHGKGFADMLRALLRQDPDVLLLGEIRDADTAKISMQATMTGHLVLSTVHAQDTLKTVFRLLDLGADPNMVASSLDLVLGQRLVRMLCQHCRKRRLPDKQEARRMGRFSRDMIYDPRGCSKCLNTGFAGRRAIFELLATDNNLRDVILSSPTLRDLRQAVGPDFMTLRDHGHHLVAEGATSFEEIDRVIGVE